ncbi:MAG: hypothetical protein K2K25_13070 [Muribaculaceae bacterium]|nr:hypothetical protein [Muribaculaceae bacterium]
MKISIIGILTALFLTNCSHNEKTPIGMSPDIFHDTPGRTAALAIIKDDTVALGKELEKNRDLISLRDPYYGFSLLYTAVLNNKVKSTEKLLKSGFDPNLVSDTIQGEGTTPILCASKYSDISFKTLELLLLFGGDPNSKQRFSLRDIDFENEIQDTINQHAITDAAGNDIEKVRLLLDFGAEINPKEGISPLDMAVALDKMEIALYLLEHGADYNEIYEAGDTDSQLCKSRGYATVADKLRYVFVPLDSREYEFKLRVIEFLQKKGLDYYKTEIPKHALNLIKDKYPDSWEEYIKVY